MEQKFSEVCIWDMIWCVLSKWRSMLLIAVLCMLSIGGIDYAKQVKMVQIQKQQEDEAQTTNNLSTVPENRAEAFMVFEARMNGQNEYILHAPLMKLNPNDFFVGTLRYYVQAEEKDVASICAAYEMSIHNQKLYEEIANAISFEENPSYVAELVDTKAKYCDFMLKSTNTELEIDATEKCYVTVNVYAQSKEECQIMLGLVDAYIGKQTATIANAIGVHGLSEIIKECAEVSSKELLRFQVECMKDEGVCYTYLNAINKELTEAEKNYISYVKQEVVEKPAYQAVVNKKKIVLGFTVGFLAMFCIYALGYIISNTIRTNDSLGCLFGVTEWGIVDLQNQKRKNLFALIDHAILKMRYRQANMLEEHMACTFISANISAVCKKKQIRRLCLIGCRIPKESEMFFYQLIKELEKEQITVILGGSILADADCVEKATDIGQVILVETVDKTLYRELKREIVACKDGNIQIVGLIPIHV